MRLSAYYSFRESLLTSLITVFNSSLKKQPTFPDAGTGFSGEMTSEKRAQKFRTDDVSLFFCVSAFDWVKQRVKFASANQKYYPDLVSDTSSVWNY